MNGQGVQTKYHQSGARGIANCFRDGRYRYLNSDGTPMPVEVPPAAQTLAPFLALVHADFESVADKPGTRDSLPGEDVFWWAVTILEEFAEIPALTAAKDPYVTMMRDQLRNLAGRLAAGEPLPPGLEIHWFDDDGEGG